MSVYIDISEFIANPIRTGIQRVVREVIVNWPADVQARFCAYAAEGDMFYELPDRVINLAIDGAGNGGLSSPELGRRISEADLPGRRRCLPICGGQRILIPEVFYDPSRMNAYRRLADSVGIAPSVIVFDFAAYFHPDAFKVAVTTSNFILPYLYLVRGAARRAFPNEIVAEQYTSRINRTRCRSPSDTVVRLGADGLGVNGLVWNAERRTILCLGSFDGKKHQNLLYDAYMQSDRLQLAFDLLFIGRKPESWQSTAFKPIFANRHPGIRILDDASDAQVREAFSSARATAFLGTFEGFGLPAVESLAAGVPVIAWSQLPALHGIAAAGQLRLDEVNVASITQALETLIDDEAAAQLWREAARLQLDSWVDYARAISEWIMA